MRLLIGGTPYNEPPNSVLDAHAVRYKGTTADPVPTANVTLVDNNSGITITPLSELIILDEKVIANPTQNFLLGPALLSTDTSNWFATSSAGFGGTVSFSGAPPVTASVLNDTHVGYALRAQNIQVGLVIPGQTYMLSGYINIATPMTNAQSILKFDFLDANLNIIGSAGVADYRSSTAGNARQRISMSAVAPVGAFSMQVAFGIQTTAQPTNSGTALFDTIQLEPMWFPSIISYPSSDCLPTSTNCRVLPNETTIRQYRKFGGLVVDAIYGEYKGNIRTIQVTANGYAWLLSGCYTNIAYTNTNDSAIITSLINAAFTPRLDGTQLFNTSSATNITGNQIDNFQPNWDDLRSIFNSFAANAGYFWTADPYWNFIYQPPGYTQMPIALIADNSGANPDFVTTFPVYNFKAEMDLTQLGSTALVLGGSVTTYLLTGLSTTGGPYTTLDVAPMPVPVLSGTALSISGNQGVILSSQANKGDTTLHINSFNALKNYGVGAAISSNPYVGQVIDVANTNIYNQAIFGYGVPGSVFMRKVNDGALQSVADVTGRGIAELIQYSTPRNLYHGVTNVELIYGQAIQVSSNTDNLASTSLLIQQVSAQWLGTDETLHDVWEYQVDLGAINRSASSIMSHIFRQTVKNSSAPAITNVALMALEKYNMIESAAVFSGSGLGGGGGGSGGGGVTFTQPYGVTIGHPLATGTIDQSATVGTAVADMQNLGVTWLRFQIPWHAVDATGTTNQNTATYTWTGWDDAVSQCNANGINIILSIFGAPSQFQINGNKLDPTYTANFATQIANRYNGGVHGSVQGIEIGNEDYDVGTPDPADVAHFILTMKAVYPAIKAVLPSAKVGCAAMLQRNSAHITAYHETLLNPSTGAYIGGVFQGDYLNFHYYTGAPTSGTCSLNSSFGTPVSLDPTIDIPSWNSGAGLPSITTMWGLIQAKIQQYQANLPANFPVWVTETGFQINNNPGRNPCATVSQATQWQYLQDVLDSCRQSGVVQKAFVFTLGYFAGYTGSNPNYRDGMSLVQGTIASPVQTTAYNGLVNYTNQYASWNAGSSGGTTALTAYFTAQAASTVATANLLYIVGGTPANINKASTLGTALNWGEITSQGTVAAWAAAGSMPAPTGKGFLLDNTSLEGHTLQAGAHTANIRLNMVGAGAVAITADIHVALYKRSSGAVYTLIADTLLTGQTIHTTKTVYNPTFTTSGTTAFGTGDKLYISCMAKVLTNTGPSTASIQLNDLTTDTAGLTGMSTADVATPGYV
jgi:hypothetical protein